jgi:hypothetical protein
LFAVLLSASPNLDIGPVRQSPILARKVNTRRIVVAMLSDASESEQSEGMSLDCEVLTTSLAADAFRGEEARRLAETLEGTELARARGVHVLRVEGLEGRQLSELMLDGLFDVDLVEQRKIPEAPDEVFASTVRPRASKSHLARFLKRYRDLPEDLPYAETYLRVLRAGAAGKSYEYGVVREPERQMRLPGGVDLEDLGCLYRAAGCRTAGITTPFTYVGSPGSTFALHVEDGNFSAVSYLHAGAPKIWYVLPPDRAAQVEALLSVFKDDLVSKEHGRHCRCYLQHKTCSPTPSFFLRRGVPVTQVVQRPGDLVMLLPRAFHFGYNLGVNVAQVGFCSRFSRARSQSSPLLSGGKHTHGHLVGPGERGPCLLQVRTGPQESEDVAGGEAALPRGRRQGEKPGRATERRARPTLLLYPQIDAVRRELGKAGAPGRPEVESGVRYECGICGVTFARLRDAKRHMKRKHGIEPSYKSQDNFACPTPGCGRAYRHSSALSRHLKSCARE